MISIIIPALNEAIALPATLQQLHEQSGDFEVILVDGGSTDSTTEVAAGWSTVQVLHSLPGRAVQMNTGASAAQGELLLFLHADTILPPGSVRRLNNLESEPGVQWGGFHQRFSGDTWALRLISRMHNLRCGITRIFYGDQSIFVRRELFDDVNGFPDVSILEDVNLSETLLEHVEPTFLPEAVLTDSRKFEQMGSFRSLGRCILIILCNELKLPIIGRRFFAPIR